MPALRAADNKASLGFPPITTLPTPEARALAKSGFMPGARAGAKAPNATGATVFIKLFKFKPIMLPLQYRYHYTALLFQVQ